MKKKLLLFIPSSFLLSSPSPPFFFLYTTKALALVISFSFPLMAQPCIANIDALLFPRKESSLFRHLFLVFSLVGIAYMVAMLVEDVSIVLGISGATAATTISFILPSLVYLRLDSRTKAPVSGGAGSIFTLAHIPAIILLALGLMFFVVSTVVTLIPEDSTPSSPLCNPAGNGTLPVNQTLVTIW